MNIQVESGLYQMEERRSEERDAVGRKWLDKSTDFLGPK
jgi:hypothetical protein